MHTPWLFIKILKSMIGFVIGKIILKFFFLINNFIQLKNLTFPVNVKSKPDLRCCVQ